MTTQIHLGLVLVKEQPPVNIINHYEALGKQTADILNTSLKNDLSVFSSNHSFLNDYAIWLDVLNKRPELTIYNNAIKELQIAMLCNVLGLYQQAFMGLRFFLERNLVGVLFSANELELNLWRMGDRDTYWNEVMDKEKGVFSPKFSKAFFSGISAECPHFIAISLKVYRECSEFVHGNNAVIGRIPEKLQHSADLFAEWNSKADTIKRIILFAFCLRYLKDLNKSDIGKVAGTISDEFKSIIPISVILT